MNAMTFGQISYSSWARSLSSLTGIKISKQAIFYRMTDAWVLTLKTLVAKVIGQQAGRQIKHKLFTGFKNVWIQDSTCVHLPQALLKRFTGSVVNGKQNSVAKLNVVVHALSGLCPLMEWDSYTVAEQSLSSAIMGIAKAGDIVIRDLGYFVLRMFKIMDEEGIFFLSKWKYRVSLFDIGTKEEICLINKLRGKSYIDMWVLCGKEEQVKVRIVAIKLSAAQTAERIRKAKKDRNRRANHSEQYYALLGYVIFITNVSEEIWNYKQVSQAYRVRWNIEILFKSWKSGLHMERMIPDAAIHTQCVEGVLYLMLLYIAWFHLLVYAPLRWNRHEQGKYVSIIQTAKWMFENTMRWITQEITNVMRKEILYYCCYETRRRVNATGQLSHFFEDLT